MSSGTGPRYNLVLVHTAGWQDVADFAALGQLISAQAPDIEVFILDNASRSPILRKKIGQRPTLVFSPVRLLNFRPARGKIWQGQPMSKLSEMRRLADAGLPVPFFEELTPTTLLLEALYGPLVILKPSYALASFGQGVELRHTGSVAYRTPEDFPEEHAGRHGPMIVQKFVDCGRAMTCRVLTLFGVPIFSFHREATRNMALDLKQESFQQADYMPSPPWLITFISRDPEILALAQAAWRAMPDVALQACDIVRARTGELYLLEVNPGGGTWMFSNSNAAIYKIRLGLADLAEPFNALQVCAGLLIERTRAEAC